jgi:hypothetical protein
MAEREYIIKDDNTQKVFLSEDTLDVVEILEKYYGYILDALREEGIILKAHECSLFKELVFENRVVGFCSYDFSRQFITVALNNVYVLPEFRGNGIFHEELLKTMKEHNKPSIMEPTRLVVELLIKYGLAKRISEGIVASSLEFIIPGNHVLSNAEYDSSEELSTHFYDLDTCASIHFLDLENNRIAYSEPLNHDIIHYDCMERRKVLDESYFDALRQIFISRDVEIMNVILDLEDSLPVMSYSLEDVVGEGDEFSPYIETLIDDAHITYDQALRIKQQITEEYEAGMILNESLFIRLAYLFGDRVEPSIKSHSDVCPYCSMPIDSHDKFCHFCGLNLKYDPDEMFDSFMDYLSDSNIELNEDIRFVAYKFLKLIRQGIDVEYSIYTIEHSYGIEWSILKRYLEESLYFADGRVTEKGLTFMDNHPLEIYDMYCLNMVDYTDFEKYYYENQNLNKKEIVLNYLKQFNGEYEDIIDEIKDK